MKRLVRFNQFTKNEELHHGYSGVGEGGGSPLLNKIGKRAASWIGRKLFKNVVDIAENLLEEEIDSQIENGEIDENDKGLFLSQVGMKITEKSLKGKSEEEILEFLKSHIDFMKKELGGK